jgi:hypothetical protein
MITNWASRLKHYLAYRRWRQITQNLWRQRFRKILSLHPEYGRPCDPVMEAEHRSYWADLQKGINLLTLRVCSAISEQTNPKIVPEEVYDVHIEPSLNRHRMAEFLAHKSGYERWFVGGAFVAAHLHNVDGCFFGPDFRPIARDDVGRLLDKLSFPVVFKPNMGTIGGKDVFLPKTREELISLLKRRQDYIIQPRMEQDEFFGKFNRAGLNTLRVCLYRSVQTEEIHVLNVALRMGVGGSLDNETAGGIVCFVRSDGSLNNYAVDKHGKKFLSHPDTGIAFGQCERIPDFEGLKDLARSVARDLFLIRLTSLDMFKDTEGRWRVLEVNLFGQTIRFSQYGGEPFFGRFTDEVFEYCRANRWWQSL